MRIVKIIGGLGNQMFQYAFSRELAFRTGSEVLLDTSAYSGYGLHNGYELERVFSIKARFANASDVGRLSTRPRGLLSRFKRKYLTKSTHYIDKYFGFNDSVFSRPEPCYYDGYWQSEKYFSHAVGEMWDLFVFQGALDPATSELIASMPRPSLSVHVRRGDYLKSHNQYVCKADYYNKALDAALSVGDIASVVFVSDDPAWCRDALRRDGVSMFFPDWNRADGSWRDMAIMAACDHNIVANSSFSWWGAWLNRNPGKRVYAPAVWNRRQIASSDPYYSFTFDDIVPATWIRIQNDV